MIRSILSGCQNMERYIINWDASGEVLFSAYEYVDDGTYVFERDNGQYVYIQYKDGAYEYDPSVIDRIQVYFTMPEIAALEWEELLDDGFGISESVGEKITQMAELEDGLHITMEVGAQNGADAVHSEMVASAEEGDKIVNEVVLDPETYYAQNVTVYLEKSDGTRIKGFQCVFSYDVELYEPSEDMLQCMKGTDRTATLIADPETEKERTYTKSCRADGVFAMYLYGDYENFYLDESCTELYTGQEYSGDILVYAAEGK